MRRLLLAVLLACATALCWSAATRATPSPRTLDILVVAGQSNALCDQAYVVDPTTHRNVLAASRSPADARVLLMWDETGVPSSGADPVPLDAPQRLRGAPSPVFGPEVGRGRALYAAGHHHLLVVKVVFPGSSLAVDWQVGSRDFDAMVAGVRAAEAWATSSGWTPSIAGFYWMQGESDARKAPWAATYRAHLLGFIASVRRQLDLHRATPFVLGQIDLADFIGYEQARHDCTTRSCTAEKRWNEEVMRAQQSVSSSSVFVASTAQLPRYEHFLHLTGAAELVLGRRFAALSERHLT
jgi:hypothetical protein